MPEPLEIPVEVDTSDASRILDDFADEVEELTDQFKPVELDVDTSEAQDAIGDVRDDLDKLGGEAITPEIRPEVDQGSVDKARKQVSDRVSEGGGEAGQKFGAGFARDFGGIVNEQAAGIGGDLTDGIATAFEAFGVSASLAGPLTAALGIGTVVVAAAATLWQAMNAGAEEYKKKLGEATTMQKNLATGQLTQAVEDMEAKLAPLAKTMAQFGISTGEAAEFILGATDELGLFNQEMNPDLMAKVDERAQELGVTNGTLMRSFRDTRDELLTMRNASDEAGTSFSHTQQRMFEIIAAMEKTGASTEEVTGALVDLAKQTKGPTQDAILTHIATLNGIPPSKITAILADTDPNNVAQVEAEIDAIAKGERTARIRVVPDVDHAAWARVQTLWAPSVKVAPASAAAGVRDYERRNGPV